MYCLPPARERHREALHRRAEPRLPEHRAGLHVERAEAAIEIADERDPAGGRQHRGEERRALLDAPHLLHRRDIVGRQLADVAVRARHLEEAPIRVVPPAPSFSSILRPDISMHDWLSGMISDVGRRVVAHRLPVVAALGARARLDPLLDLLLDDVGAVGDAAPVFGSMRS